VDTDNSLQGWVFRFGRHAGRAIGGHAEDAVGGAVQGSDRHVLAGRIHCGGRDVEGGGG
jgi:hypothetical protein